jgi:hypothetical protein
LTPNSPNLEPSLAAILTSRWKWESQLARPEQIPNDEGDWSVYLYLAGRGAGKTRTAAEWIAWQASKRPNTRWAVVAATFGDVRDTCAEGESGLVPILRRYGTLKNFNRSMGEIKLNNGSLIKLFSAEDPDRLRGPQFHGAWCDELAAWRYPETYEQLQFTLRLGQHPQTIITTTPQPKKLIRELISKTDGSVVIVRGSTFDNAKNLAPSALQQLRNRYEGTRLGRQELFAEILEDTPGALWTMDMLDACRIDNVPEMSRVVVAIDPASTSNENSDETGIVVVGKGIDNRGYVLADRSCRMSPDGWAKRAIAAYDEFEASRIVGETNMGGDMIETIIRQYRPNIPYRGVVARKGKILRAEPISSLYEQGRISHCGVFPELEEQMTSWVSDQSDFSPDRIDALVHGFTQLGIGAGGFSDAFFNSVAPPCPHCDLPNGTDKTHCSGCGKPLH